MKLQERDPKEVSDSTPEPSPETTSNRKNKRARSMEELGRTRPSLNTFHKCEEVLENLQNWVLRDAEGKVPAIDL